MLTQVQSILPPQRPDCECGHLAISHRMFFGCGAVDQKLSTDVTKFVCQCPEYMAKKETG